MVSSSNQAMGYYDALNDRYSIEQQIIEQKRAYERYKQEAMGNRLEGLLGRGSSPNLAQQAKPVAKPEPNPVLLLLGDDE